MVAIEYDDGSGEYDEGYYVYVDDDTEMGPLTDEELQELNRCTSAHFGN